MIDDSMIDSFIPSFFFHERGDLVSIWSDLGPEAGKGLFDPFD